MITYAKGSAISDGPATIQEARFYRPELDVLRFAAFFAVFIFHAPRIPRLAFVQEAGSFGLPLFFFLSAFLITELLVREREKLGTIHLRAFYIRRILRIWPLYFLGVFTAILWSHYEPRYHLEAVQIAYLMLFVGFLGKQLNYNPAGVLWSVSVEEIFYLFWPLAGKMKAFGWACLSLFVCSVIALFSTTNLWYNPLVNFFYFACGGLVALVLHRNKLDLSNPIRVALMAAAITIFLCGVQFPLGLLRSVLGGAGCSLAMLALLNVKASLMPQTLIYLGKISYGLYVFHLSCLVLVTSFVDELGLGMRKSIHAFIIQSLALLLCIGVAAISYRYFEKPFLKLKKHFELVRSRPV